MSTTDKLNRSSYINFIKNLIINSNKYKRSSEISSYIIAIDSPWGSGKTTLVNLLHESIEADQTNTIKVIRYNAWKNDYSDNPFSALFLEVIKSEIFEEVRKDKEFIKNLIPIGRAICKDIASAFNFSNTLDCLTENQEPTNILAINYIKEHSDQIMAFEKFSTILREKAKWLNTNANKLVIVIDELDRCKPTFAIKTLEILKHFFNIDNIVFILAVDLQQLSHSIKCIYGQDMDSSGYLCRFFDYITKMPQADMQPYIEGYIENMGRSYLTNEKLYLSKLFLDLYNHFNLSIRDLNTILLNYKVMLNSFLFEYSEIKAHSIYIFFVTIKYKFPRLFDDIFSNQKNTPSYDLIKNFPFKTFYENIGSSLNYLLDNSALCDYNWEITSSKNFLPRFNKIKIDNITYPEIIFNSMKLPYLTESHYSYNHILYNCDFKNWQTIKNYTYREFLHKKLENYNFSEILNT